MSKYFFRDTTDFGDETNFWRDVTKLVEKTGSFNPLDSVEYIIETFNPYLDEYTYVWKTRKNIYGYEFKAPTYVALNKQTFDKHIKPFILPNKEEKMKNNEYN